MVQLNEVKIVLTTRGIGGAVRMGVGAKRRRRRYKCSNYKDWSQARRRRRGTDTCQSAGTMQSQLGNAQKRGEAGNGDMREVEPVNTRLNKHASKMPISGGRQSKRNALSRTGAPSPKQLALRRPPLPLACLGGVGYSQRPIRTPPRLQVQASRASFVLTPNWRRKRTMIFGCL